MDETERSTERGDEPRTADSESVTESSTASSWSWGERDTATEAGDAGRAERTDQQAADASGTVGATTDTSDTTTEEAAPSSGDAERDTSSTLSSWTSQWTGEYAAAPDADEQRTTANVSAAETQAQPETGVPGETAESGDTATATPTEEPLEPAVTAAWQGQSTMTDMPQSTARSEGSESGASGTAIEPSRDDIGREDFAADTASDETDVVPRAARLLDELRALLPALATASPTPTASTGETVPSAAPNASAVADELAASRHGGDDFADLRRALEAARSRPRDVDTMLDLVDRIDPMLAALDAHDRYAAAIDRAVSQLQDGDAPSAPASSERDEGHGGHFRWHSG